MKKIGLSESGEKIFVKCKKVSFFGRFIGLMFSKRENADILLFDFKKNVNYLFHSFFVFYPFLILWLDENNKILEKRIIFPFNPYIKSKVSFYKVIEIPINKNNYKIVNFLVGDLERFK